MEKKKILIFISNYLPGYKMGGPLNSVLNIVENLNENFNFYIITSDRDFGEKKPYKNIEINKWQNIRGANVLYIRNGVKGYKDILISIKEKKIDSIYLNSFFSFKFSIYITLLRYFNLIEINKLIIAPRGEFYKEALSFQKQKKYLYLKLINILKIYKNVCWHSTDISETNEIIKLFNAGANVKKASVLSDFSNTLKEIEEPVFKHDKYVLKIVFLSRISKDKNISFTFNILNKIKKNLEFHIYGPIEDQDLWKNFNKKIKTLPSNIVVNYKGPVKKENVKAILSRYDIFFLPTHRENFGHVINESLSVGTPVLISKNTPWLNLEKNKLGWDIDLENEYDFIQVIESYSDQSMGFRRSKRNEIIKNYNESINFSSLIKENIALFN